MKKIILLFYILFINNLLNGSNKFFNVPKGYKRIECKLIPTKNNIHKKRSNTNNSFFDNTNSNSNESLNWSGYLVATNLNNPQTHSVKSVTGSWIVPGLRPSNNSSCIIWVGMDGYKSSTIEQIGTAHEWINGEQINYAWFSMFPNKSFRINNFTVNISDKINGVVTYIGGGEFLLSITNHTTQEFTVVPIGFTSSPNAKRNTAQWIVESDSSDLAKFDFINFDKCQAQINNVIGSINNSNWQNKTLKMVLRSNVANVDSEPNRNILRAIASSLSNGEKFKIKWIHK